VAQVSDHDNNISTGAIQPARDDQIDPNLEGFLAQTVSTCGWGNLLRCGSPPITSENRAYSVIHVRRAAGESRDSEMDLIKTRLIESVFAGGGEMGARMRALDWSATVLGPLLSASLAARRRNADAPLMRIEPEKETDR